MWLSRLTLLLFAGLVSSQTGVNPIVTNVNIPATTPQANLTVQTPSPPNIPPVVTQCFYESRWYPAGAIINAGRSGNFCYGAYCDLDGHTKHWSKTNCPKTDPSNPEPPFPDFVTPSVPDKPVTQPPFQFQGCFFGEKYYFPGEYIRLEKRGGLCSGVFCDFNSRLQPWVDFCKKNVIPFPILDIT